MKQQSKLLKLLTLLLVGFLGMISCQKEAFYCNPEDAIAVTQTRPEMPPFIPKGFCLDSGDTHWVYNIYADYDSWKIVYVDNNMGLVNYILPGSSTAVDQSYGTVPIQMTQSGDNWLLQCSSVDSQGRPIEFVYYGPVDDLDGMDSSCLGYIWHNGHQDTIDYAGVWHYNWYNYYFNYNGRNGWEICMIHSLTPIIEGSYVLEKTPGLSIAIAGEGQNKGVLNVTRSGRHYTFSLTDPEVSDDIIFVFDGDVIPHCYDYF